MNESRKKKKPCKKDKYEKKNINVIRGFNSWIWQLSKRPLDLAIGTYYTIIHYIFIIFGSFLILFEMDPWNLTILLIVISLDAFANVILHNCPLTALEEKYLDTSMSGQRKYLLDNSGIMFKCRHIYESQIELLINVWSLTAGKIFILLTLQFFNKKIVTQ
jgi:hypothetical protein